MSLRSPAGFAATTVIAVLAGVALAAQLIANRPILGPFGLLALIVPGYVFSRALGPAVQAWPHLALTTLGSSLVLLVVTGIVAGVLPAGVGASSVGVVELIALLGAWGLLLRRWRHDPAPAEGIVVRIRPASVFLLAGGVALGSIGFLLASNAAAEQAALSRFVQFWSVDPSEGDERLMGVRNVTGVTIDCAVTIDRLGERISESQIGKIEHGQVWTGALATSGAVGGATWQVSLHCTGSDGSVVDRRLTIDPTA